MSNPIDTNNAASRLRTDTEGHQLVRHVDSSGGALSYTARVSVTRPANTTPYAAGATVGATAAVITLPNIGPANGHVEITDVDLAIQVASKPAGMTTFRVHLYSETPPSAFADGAAWSLTTADLPYYLGYLDLDTPVAMGNALFVQSNGAGSKQVKLGSTTSLFAYRVTNGAYTPTSAAVAVLRINAKGV